MPGENLDDLPAFLAVARPLGLTPLAAARLAGGASVRRGRQIAIRGCWTEVLPQLDRPVGPALASFGLVGYPGSGDKQCRSRA